MEPTKAVKSEKLTNGVIANGTSGHLTNGTDVSAKNGSSNATSESVTNGTHIQTPSIKFTNGNLKNHVINAEDNEIEEVTGKADIQIDGNLLKINRKGPVDWSDDEYEDDEEDAAAAESNVSAETESKTPQPKVSTDAAPDIEDSLSEELAVKATQIGVMQAAPGTNQGETGWYVDASTELQQWDVGSDGSWSRLQ